MPEYYHGRNAEIVALMDELRTMPEKGVLDELRALDVSVYIYRRNHAAIAEFISWMQDDPSNQDLWHQTTKQKSHACHCELARLLQNHVASVMSLVNHTRVMTTHLYADGRFPDYQPKVDAVFKNDPLVQFIQCLRNVLLHVGTAQLVFNTTVDPKTEVATNNFGLPIGYLRENVGECSSLAKKFIEQAATDSIDIPTLISEYDLKVNEFYGWFTARQQEIHADEIARYAAKEREFFLLEIEDQLDRWFFNPNPVENPAPSDRGLFLWLFDISEVEQLEQLPAGSPQRTDTAVAFLKARFEIPNDLEDKVRRACADPNFFRFDLFKAKTMEEWMTENPGEDEAE
jgi:hypothetical protein